MQWSYMSCLRPHSQWMAELALISALLSPKLCAVPASPHSLPGKRGDGGKEWGGHCFRIVLTCVSLLASQQSCNGGTVIIPICQVRKLSFRAERHFWGSRFNPHESFSRWTRFHAIRLQWKQTMDLGPPGLAQCPKFLHYTLLGVTAFWLWLKCKLYPEGITQKAIISLE